MIMTKEQNTDVKTAFELLAITLDEEQERIFKAGAKAMEQKNVDIAQAVIDFAKKLQNFQNDVNELKKRWDELQEANDIAPQDVQDIVIGDGRLFSSSRKRKTGYTRHVEQVGPRTNFRVEFAGETVIEDRLAKRVFARAIEKIGAERVSGLNLQLWGEPLLSQNQSVFVKQPSQIEKIKGGWIVKTHSSTEQKISILNKIAKALDINLKCEVVNH